jgi:hypothetical protein
VQIVRFVDEYQPGIVACELLDAACHCHTIIAKVPLVLIDKHPRSGLPGGRSLVGRGFRDS